MPLFVVSSGSFGLTTTRSPSGFSDMGIAVPFCARITSLTVPARRSRDVLDTGLPASGRGWSGPPCSRRRQAASVDTALLVEQPLVDGLGRVVKPMTVTLLVRLDPSHVEL